MKKMTKKNIFEKGGELGVKIIKFVTVEPVKLGYRRGRGR